MQEFTLRITISADGETVTGQIHGIKGKKCTNVAHLLDEIGQETEHYHTYEYDEKEPVQLTGTAGESVVQLGGRYHFPS